MKTLQEIGEFGLIERISRMITTSPDVLESVGDDCAVLRFGDRKLLVSSDMAIEGNHFLRDSARPYDIGYKAAAAAISDIAAMGGSPLFCLVSLSCPGDTPVPFLESLYQGLNNLLSSFGVMLVGGDTTRAESKIFIDVVVLGEAKGDHLLKRSGAQEGDILAVTGHLGVSSAAVHAIENGIDAPRFVARHFAPQPRIVEGQWLARTRGIRAMIDVSDGLIQDAGHLAHAAGIGVDIDSSALLIDGALKLYGETHQVDPLDFVLSGGEDFELACAIDPLHADEVFRRYALEFRIPLTPVGRFTHEWEGARVDGQVSHLHGFDHFKA